MPKEDRFFGLFETYAALVVTGAEALRAALQGDSEERHHLKIVSDSALQGLKGGDFKKQHGRRS